MRLSSTTPDISSAVKPKRCETWHLTEVSLLLFFSLSAEGHKGHFYGPKISFIFATAYFFLFLKNIYHTISSSRVQKIKKKKFKEEKKERRPVELVCDVIWKNPLYKSSES